MLLSTGTDGGGSGVVVTAESLGEAAALLVSPAAIVLDHAMGDVAHYRSNLHLAERQASRHKCLCADPVRRRAPVERTAPERQENRRADKNGRDPRGRPKSKRRIGDDPADIGPNRDPKMNAATLNADATSTASGAWIFAS